MRRVRCSWAGCSECGLSRGPSDSHATWAALLGALVFALHPVQTEAVTYISGRSTSLAALFSLLSLGSWVRSENAPSSRSSATWLIACAAAYAAAIACKETAFVLPLALWLYSADRPVKATLARLTPLFLLAIVLLGVAYSVPTYRHLLAVSLETRSISENLLTQSHAILYLAGQLVRPWNGNADPQLSVVNAADSFTILLCIAWAAALIAALINVRRTPLGAFAVLWFLLWLAPTNSFLPRLDPANDRQLYLALIGPAWWVSARLIGVSRHSSLVVAVLAFLRGGRAQRCDRRAQSHLRHRSLVLGRHASAQPDERPCGQQPRDGVCDRLPTRRGTERVHARHLARRLRLPREDQPRVTATGQPARRRRQSLSISYGLKTQTKKRPDASTPGPGFSTIDLTASDQNLRLIVTAHSRGRPG